MSLDEVSLNPLIDLAKQIHPVYGPFAIIVAILAFRAHRSFRQMVKEQTESAAVRQARLDAGFTALDTGRDQEIADLRATLKRTRGDAEEDSGRHRAEVERHLGRLAVVAADRDRGWDVARELLSDLHEMRHEANNRILIAWGVAELAMRGITQDREGNPFECPPEFSKIKPMRDRAGKKPHEVEENWT